MKIIDADVYRWFSRVFMTLLHVKRKSCHMWIECSLLSQLQALERDWLFCHMQVKLTSWHFHMWTKMLKWKENSVVCCYLFVVWDPLKGLVSQRSTSLCRSFDVLTPIFNLLPIIIKTRTKACFIPHDHTAGVIVRYEACLSVVRLTHKRVGSQTALSDCQHKCRASADHLTTPQTCSRLLITRGVFNYVIVATVFQVWMREGDFWESPPDCCNVKRRNIYYHWLVAGTRMCEDGV